MDVGNFVQVLKLKDGKIQELVDDAQNARREVVDKEQSLGVLEMKLANIQKAYDQDKEVSEAAMKALQKDQNSSLELVTECRDLRVQVANLSAEAFTEKHRAQSLEKVSSTYVDDFGRCSNMNRQLFSTFLDTLLRTKDQN